MLLGYIAYNAFSGNAPGAAPLYCFWNSKLKDNMLAPFTAANDVNDLVSGSGWTMYRRKAYIGNMAMGTCDACFTEVARTFGNAGGPGCPKSNSVEIASRVSQVPSANLLFEWQVAVGHRDSPRDLSGP